MAGTLIQFRTEEASKVKATSICNELGMELSTYLKICMQRLIQENGIPFSMKIASDEKANAAIDAMKKLSLSAKDNGISNMSLEEINEEIAKSRK